LKKLLIVDGNSILNRAFYGIHPLSTSDGIPTNAVFGFTNILLSHLDGIKPDYAAVAFDLKAPTFRHKSYGDYKAGRRAMPDELAVQLDWAKRAVAALGMRSLTLEGWEADDILGTLSALAEKEDCDSYIITGDRDSLQLISDRTTVLLATNAETVRFDRAHFTEVYGIPPEQFVFVKALMGDSSDNIPGVPGVGEKTALKLISQFHSLDALYEGYTNAGLTKSVAAKLEAGRDSAYMSLALAKIDCAAPLGTELSDIAYSGIDRAAMTTLCRRLELSGFIKRLALEDEENVPDAVEYLPLDADSLTSLAVVPTALSIDFSGGVMRIYSESFAHEVRFTDAEQLIPFLTSERSLSVFDVKTIYGELYKLTGKKTAVSVTTDVMLAAYVINSSDSKYNLESLCTRYLSRTHVPDDSAREIFELAAVLGERMRLDGASRLYDEIELPLAHVLFEMETSGFLVDTKGLADFSDELAAQADSYASQIFAYAGHTFNPNSPKQLGEVLFEELKLPSPKRTKSGYSTSADVLEKLRDVHPIIDCILEYRQVAKLKSTYADGLRAVADGDGRIHTTFNQTVTATGRLSSTEPNLQNIPIRQELGRRFRRYFLPDSAGRLLVDADYSQIELRLLAHIADDATMIEAFKSGIDIHAVTASQVFGVPLGEVTSDMRKRAKAVNFGIVYGISDFSLAQDIGVTKKQAGEYIKGYLAKYPGVGEYLADIVERANRDGYVTTLLGRRRYIPELKSGKAMLRSFGERVAMNSPIQGSAADIIKLAMINVEAALEKSGIDAKLILQVHDELIVECAAGCAAKAEEILRREMEGAVTLSVPLTVDVQTGSTWMMDD